MRTFTACLLNMQVTKTEWLVLALPITSYEIWTSYLTRLGLNIPLGEMKQQEFLNVLLF